MARGQRPRLEAAVSESPLFRLPLELRTDIYKRLLVQRGGMSVPGDVFKRVKASRQASRPQCCRSCFAIFSNRNDYCRHPCRFAVYESMDGIESSSYITGIPNLPDVSTPILRASRLIHLEALPILYIKNAFYFSNPPTAHAFLWNASRAQAAFIREIIITLNKPHYPYESQYDSLVDPWLKYVMHEKAGLAQDFPHVRRLIINLGSGFRLASSNRVLPVFQSLAKSVQGLDWVHVNGVNDEKLLEYLEPMVSRNKDRQMVQRQAQSHATEHNEGDSYRPSSSPMQVRYNVTESTNAVGWKNATLWWGTSEAAVPYECRPRKPSRQRERLFRLGSGEDAGYMAGSSFL